MSPKPPIICVVGLGYVGLPLAHAFGKTEWKTYGYDLSKERIEELNKGKEPPEFMSTHPSSNNRIKNLNNWIGEIILDYPPIISS